jgi:DNA repair exonuclease SbcCD ATPase subunit
MKTKLVLWGQKGSEENAEKVLIAVELNANANCVDTWIFSGEAASEELSDQLMNNWRKGEAVAFPEGLEQIRTELSASGSILPEGYSAADKEDLVKRTQTEWLFIVLSTKLFQTYESELNTLQDKVEKMTKYSKEMWEELKTFQTKIQTQVQEQNLFREHTNILRERLNELFGSLKKLREVEDSAFETAANEVFQKMSNTLNQIDEAVEKNSGDWAKWFDKLKGLQVELKTAKLTREGRNEIWARIDKAFKEVKDRRFGGSSAQNSNSGNVETRLQRRIEGLKEAIQKMDNSVSRDQKDYDFLFKKLNNSNATQLEAQLSEVRAKMILERLESKKAKLADMNKTLADLESRLARVLAKTATAEDLKAAEDETGVQETVVSEEAGALDETGQSEETEAGEREGENTEV